MASNGTIRVVSRALLLLEMPSAAGISPKVPRSRRFALHITFIDRPQPPGDCSVKRSRQIRALDPADAVKAVPCRRLKGRRLKFTE